MISKRTSAFAAAVILIGSAVALASFLGSNSVADHLGTSGKTITQRNGSVSTSSLENRELAIFAQKDTSVTPAGICGTIDYKALRSISCNYIYRFKYEIKDPDGASWTTVLDVTEPDSRITNPTSGNYNTFSGAYSHANAIRGLITRATIWESSTDTSPMVFTYGISHP